MNFCTVSNLECRYLQQGTGPSLVIVHGWGCSLETVQSLVEGLSREFRVTALELPGHGKSHAPAEIWGSWEFARFLDAFLNALGIERTHLLGHSVGGRFAAVLSSEQPAKVERLILMDSSGIKPPRPLKYYLKVALAKVGKFAERYLGPLGAELKKRIYSKIASADYQSAGELRKSFVKIVNEDIREILPKISAKTLLLWGEEDRDTPVSSGELMKQLIPDSELVVIKSAGHYPFLDQPEKVRLYIRKFLTENPLAKLG